jgi:hypothetical protein
MTARCGERGVFEIAPNRHISFWLTRGFRRQMLPSPIAGPTMAASHMETHMAKAAERSITPFPFEVTAQSNEYIGSGKLRVSLEIKTGEPLFYVISTSLLVQSVNLAVELFKSNSRAMLGDLNVF